MEAEVPTVREGATPTGLTALHPHNPPRFFTGRMPLLPPNQQRQSAKGTLCLQCFTHINIVFSYPKLTVMLIRQ